VPERPAVVVQPDLIFVARAHGERLASHGLVGVPDIAVEVLSPSNARIDTIRKLGIYARHGVREYWIVPDEFDRIEVLRLDGARYGKPQLYEPGEVLSSPLLPGFALEVAELFAPPEASSPPP